MPSFNPEPFGKYYLLDKIAVGGMAEIFKAKSFGVEGFEKLLVIKRILAHLSENQDFVAMFVDEAKVSVALQHANIVQTYDFGRIGNNYYIAMECVDGKDLKMLLRKLATKRKLLPIEFAVYVAHEVCKGLEYAHRRNDLSGHALGIVHRDMSPSNVLIGYEGDIKIADFGIAKADSNVYTTDAGVLKGKFEYMSPEQAAGKAVDSRSDIFSAGIMLHEMLTGRRLFKTDSDVKTLEMIKACDIQPPSAKNPAIPMRLDQIVMRALTRDPAERYNSARDFQNDLLEFLYPATPDLTRQNLHTFLHTIFSDEINAERNRLELGTRAAIELHQSEPEISLEPEWEEHHATNTTMRTPAPVAKQSSWLPWTILAAVLTAGGLWTLEDEPAPPPPSIEGPVAQETKARLVAKSSVEATFLLNNEVIGQGATVKVEQLDPEKTYTLRVEAEGYEPHEREITLDAGKNSIYVPLQEITNAPTPQPRSTPQPTSSAEATTSTIVFTSSPPRANVFIDGGLIGRTPYTWSNASPGKAMEVTYELSGYESSRFRVTAPDSAGVRDEHRDLKRVARAPGKISINVSPGWAYIEIDGRRVQGETTPLTDYKLSPGPHVIRVFHPERGFDATKKITVRSGQTETVSFTAE